MRMTQFTTALAAAAIVAGFAVPAQADVTRTTAQIDAARQAGIVRAACKQSFSTARCGNYQSQLIKAVAIRAASNHKVSEQEIGNRQLDVLIGSVN